MENTTTATMSQTNVLLSFKDYLFKNGYNKTILLIAGIAIILQFAIFKYFYPYVSYIHGDSFVYLETAYKNMGINTYMIGYSMFLRFFSIFTTSDTILAGFQYLLIQASALFLVFTIFYFYSPGKTFRSILFSFVVLNPLFLYMGNMVSSDGLFLALSLIWFTILLWIVYKANLRLIIWHAVILYFAFTVRYNAIIYIFVSSSAFLLSKESFRIKAIGIGAFLLMIGLFVLNTGNQYKALTGTWQYSPFAGWQLANNAMYAYRYVPSEARKPVPIKFRALDDSIRIYFDGARDVYKNPQEGMMASTVYMWAHFSPLYKYRNALLANDPKDSTASEFKKWAMMGPLYKQYGSYIIAQYPSYFFRYYLWYNALKYYAPPVEFLNFYNTGSDSVLPIAKAWFRYKSLKVTTRTKDSKITVLDFYPIFSGTINVVMLFCLIIFFCLERWRPLNPFRIAILLGGAVWLLNAGFTIFASSAALRFQAFPIILTSIITGMLVNWLWQQAFGKAIVKIKSVEKKVMPA